VPIFGHGRDASQNPAAGSNPQASRMDQKIMVAWRDRVLELLCGNDFGSNFAVCGWSNIFGKILVAWIR
jgi:hypothetical protein